MASTPSFDAERLIERDVLGPGIDLYDRKRGRLYRCAFCHLGFSPANNPASQEKARTHVATQHSQQARTTITNIA
jgi:hypothetical protein